MKSKIVWPVLSVLVAAGIFISSSVSGEVSGSASMAIAVYVRNLVPLDDDLLNFLVRKAAHFIVYFALAFCVAQSLKFHVHRLRLLLAVSWVIAAVYGVTDEIHQYFVPGRVMAFSDMVINAAGAFFGAGLVVWYLCKFAHRSAYAVGENSVD
jgi:VanZ family protein